MPFFNTMNQGGAPPGAARNSLANYPPKGTGFAATKPPAPAPGGYRYGAAPKPGGVLGAGTGQAEAAPGIDPYNGLGKDAWEAQNPPGSALNPLPRQATPDFVPQGNMTRMPDQQRLLEKQMRQDQRRINRSGINDPYDPSQDTTNPTPGEPPLTGANRPGMQYRQDRRQAARQAGLGDTTDPTMGEPPMEAGGDPNQPWRAARRQANRQGFISQNEGGGYSPVGATPGPGGPPNFAEGANRNGMGWRDMRRQAKRQGTFTPPPPQKPGQPPAM